VNETKSARDFALHDSGSTPMPPFETVCIVGVGLIGGSFGLAIKAAGLAKRVVGVARRPETIEKAIARGAIDEGGADAATVAAGADFVFLAPPVAQMRGLCEQIAPVLRAGAIVTDAGSTKSNIVRECTPVFAGKASFVGGHPMAGSEQTGVDAARADLFKDAMWLLTPTSRTPDFAVANLKKLVENLGATPLLLDPDTHDKLLAVTSHVPHITASALMQVFLQSRAEHEIVQKLVGSGWRDATRVAAGSPEMWRDICLANRASVGRSVADLVMELNRFQALLEKSDGEALFDWFDSAATARRKQGYVPRSTR